MIFFFREIKIFLFYRGFSWTNSTSPVRPHSLPPRPGHQRHQPASAGSGSNEERIIPIMVERPTTTTRSGSAGSSRPPPPQRQESTSSAISTAGEGQGPPPQPLENTKNRGNGSHRFSDSMTSSTSSSGLGTDIHSKFLNVFKDWGGLKITIF